MGKKKIIVVAAVGIVSLTLVGLWFIFRDTSKVEKITIKNWDGCDKEYVIFEVKTPDFGESTSADVINSYFEYSGDIEELVKSNKDYCGEITYYDDILETKGYLFYSNNNYFVVSKSDSKDTYSVDNLFSEYEYSGSIVYFPTYGSFDISEEASEIDKENKNDIWGDFFERESYEKIREFYNRLDKELVEIDDKNQIITVDGYDIRKGKKVDKLISFDFNKREIKGKDKNGNWISIYKK